MNKRFEAMGESMIEQAAIGAVKTEYTALGMDTDSLQTNYVLRTGGVMLVISLFPVYVRLWSVIFRHGCGRYGT